MFTVAVIALSGIHEFPFGNEWRAGASLDPHWAFLPRRRRELSQVHSGLHRVVRLSLPLAFGDVWKPSSVAPENHADEVLQKVAATPGGAAQPEGGGVAPK